MLQPHSPNPRDEVNRYRVGDMCRLPKDPTRQYDPLLNPIVRRTWQVVGFPADDHLVTLAPVGKPSHTRTIAYRWISEYLPGEHAPITPPAIDRERGRFNLGEARGEIDRRPGNYYVTARRDDGRAAFLLGPFDSHREAWARVQEGRKRAEGVDMRAIWYSYGTARVDLPRAECPQAIFTTEATS